MFSLELIRAHEGDCLMIHYGSEDDPGLALIDGGPGDVYRQELKPRLAGIRQARGLANDKSLSIDLLMVSHIDDDHINGILDMTNELVVASNDSKPLPVKVHRFWYNTFDDIIGKNPKELLRAVTASFGAASLTGHPNTEGIAPETAQVLASVEQGARLRDNAKRLKFLMNSEFDGKLVMATKNGKSVDIGKGLRFTVIGPMQAELIALQKDHDNWLKEQKKDKAPKGLLSSFVDASVPNLSSIVVMAEVQKKRMLLAGDARGDKILQGMERVGLLKPNEKLHVDLLKMPHHGSDRNIDPTFFQRITADHYVFSGDGQYGNPERETFQMLLDAQGDAEFTMHLTYPIEETDIKRKQDWESEQKKERTRKKKSPNLTVRKNWSPKKQSLAAFFAAHPTFSTKVRIVEEGKPYIISLLPL